MAIIAKSSGGGGDFTPVSEGLHPAVCWAVVDLGIQAKGGMYPGEAHQLYLGFEVLDQTIEFDRDGKKEVGPMRTGITLTNSLGEKAKLRKFAEKWRGQPFTEQELRGFDVEKMAGQPCQVLVTHSSKGDKTYANIENILSWPKGKDKPDKSEILTYALDAPERNWERVPKWLQEKIEKRLADNWEEFNQKAPAKAKAPAQDEVPFDDDIPF